MVVPERRAAGMTAGAWKTSAGTAARTPGRPRHQPDPRPGGATRRPASPSSASPPTASTRSATWRRSAGPVVIVVGSEGKGLSRLVGETCDYRVRIPMPGGAESLNAGVAAGIVLYEAARRRA